MRVKRDWSVCIIAFYSSIDLYNWMMNLYEFGKVCEVQSSFRYVSRVAVQGAYLNVNCSAEIEVSFDRNSDNVGKLCVLFIFLQLHRSSSFIVVAAAFLLQWNTKLPNKYWGYELFKSQVLRMTRIYRLHALNGFSFRRILINSKFGKKRLIAFVCYNGCVIISSI